MPFKSILNVTGADTGDADVRVVAQLCLEVDAHLSVLVMGLAPIPATFGPPMAATWPIAWEEEMAELKASVATLQAALESQGISKSVDWDYCDLGAADDVIGQHGRYCDLTVIGPDLASSPQLRAKALEGALFSSARPVLLLPGSAKPSLSPRRILVGWDASQEAARAVRESLEMLRSADQVTVAVVDPEPGLLGHGEEPGADLAAYLARHGAKVTVARLPREGRATADVLRRHVVDTAADLLVLGAYGHSRLRDWILGGVTRSMVAEPPVPVFMAR